MNNQKKKSGGEVLVDALIAHGTKMVYCVPGESFLPVIDALYQNREQIQTIVCRHESGAGNMAEAYGKLCNEPGIAFVTRGPGATNASIAVHTARQDSTPMILFIGQVDTQAFGREAWQEIDYRHMFGSIAKWVDQIDDVQRLPEMIARAYSIATSGRPGPVVLALPEDMLSREVDSPVLTKYKRSGAAPSNEDIQSLEALVEKAKKPLLMLGGGAWTKDAGEKIAEFSNNHSLPMISAFRRQDIVDNLHSNYCGEAGLGMNPKLSARIQAADLILCVGARLGETTTNGYTLIDIPYPKNTLVHVHADANELGKVYQASLAINSTPTAFASAVFHLKNKGGDQESRKAWLKEARDDYLETLKPVKAKSGVNLSEVMIALQKLAPKETVISNGAGNYTLWVQRFYQYRGFRTQLAPTSGTMGYGLPAAIAAKLLDQSRPAICFAGDGCFLMTSQELATAVQYGANVIVIVVNNGTYGSIRMHQERHYPGNVWATDLNNPDFVELARSYGANAERIENTSDFEAAFQRAINANKPTVIELVTDKEILTPRLTVQDLRAAKS